MMPLFPGAGTNARDRLVFLRVLKDAISCLHVQNLKLNLSGWSVEERKTFLGTSLRGTVGLSGWSVGVTDTRACEHSKPNHLKTKPNLKLNRN